ncbi:MAG: PLP-dependent aminotransferase family protein [Myxococcota bacterium]
MAHELGLNTDPGSRVPLYRQIAEQLASRIHDGTMPPGFRLPPTRSLAKELGTNRNTIVAAFDHLTQRGLLVSSVGRGTYVAERSDAPPPGKPAPTSELPWSSLVSPATETASLQHVDRLRRQSARAAAKDVVNLQRMQPAEELLPVDAFRRSLQHTLRTVGAASLGYAPREGLPRLRAAIASDLGRRNIPVHAEEVMVTTGSQQALDLVARVLVSPGDTFLVQNKTYTGAIHILSAAGARLVGVPDDDEGPEIAALEQLARGGPKGFYVMPTGQNPTGRSISAKRREALVAWSHRAGVPLIEDDYCADLDLDGTVNAPSLRALDGQVLHVGTFSKRLIPALRIGYVAFPSALRQHLAGLKHAMDLGSSLLLQHALAEFLERGGLRAHLRHVLPEYRKRREALEAALTKHLPAGSEFTRARRGVATWLTLPTAIDPEAVFAAALARGVLVSPDVLFTVYGNEPGIRLTFCAESPPRLALGAKRLGQAVGDVMRSRTRQGPALSAV